MTRSDTHGGNGTILFVLFAGTRDRQEKYNYPRDANLRPHLQINRTNTRVEGGTHEYVVKEVARHSQLFSTGDGPKVRSKRYRKTPDHGDSHDVAIVVDDLREAEDVVIVQDRSGDEGRVDRVKSITVIHESFITERWDRQALLHIARHNPGKEELIENKAGIHLPCI
jgi:hypothetical protein